MFTCPRCGSHEYKTTKLRDGSVERECKGTTADTLEVDTVKADLAIRFGQADAGVIPTGTTVTKRHTRPCTFLWTPEDDAMLGVEEST